ncbi:hypothetical protein GPX89_27415 [Nocardia sp. ET3-3]|uniref:Polymerase nucleotidyl transferase domain-containing protein n=1 Tax=Nocardia terrae TaxID=2675851 RepID=A0A7K1V2W1_9NOCA|nr:hypothetical protein [Nocardia terrae]MVU80966.1 hypothetical protein [Nocardia terrae]
MEQVLAPDGERILLGAIDCAYKEFRGELAAGYAIGSLAHGGFAPLVSDIDVVLVLADCTAAARGRVAGVNAAVQRSFDGPLAQRVSIFWSDWAGIRQGAAAGCRLPAIDRLDLLESGRLLYGEDRRVGATLPQRDELICESAEFALGKIDAAYRAELGDPAGLIAAGPRAVTKTTLFPVRFLYTLGTGRIGRNEDAIDWYRGAAEPLVRAAGRWRHDGVDPAAEALLTEQLTGLYLEFAQTYRGALEELGRDDLAQRLEELRRTL